MDCQSTLLDLMQGRGRTVVTPIKNVNPCNIATDLANASPMESREHIKTRRMTSGLRRTRSPSGEMNTMPVAYPA